MAKPPRKPPARPPKGPPPEEKDTRHYRVRLALIPPIASDVTDGRKMRLVADGEECTVAKRGPDGSVLIRMESDGYLAFIGKDELEEIT